jgi:hydroxymethylglutaryl-CoA reductase
MELHKVRLYEKSVDERRKIIQEMASLSDEDLALLEKNAVCEHYLDLISENVIGAISFPLSIANHFVINNRTYLIPFSTEEASVVAAASYGAKLSSGFTAWADEPIMYGMIQLINVADAKDALRLISDHELDLIAKANTADPILIEHGGGVRSISARIVDTPRGLMILVTLRVDVRDAMGASCVTTMCELLAPDLAKITGGAACMAIINNLAVERKAYATAIWPCATLGSNTIEHIIDAYALACADIGRACTHNKGIMNGIDAVLTATGNDVRAVEAAAHAWACRSGIYQPLTTFTVNENHDLVGTLELPLAVGIVGGCTQAHPLARLSIKILGVQSAQELAAVVAAVGLAQNVAALRALVSEGIQYGHKHLHKRKINI